MELKFRHFVFLNILDIITTHFALTHMNLTEANPLLSSLFIKFGVLGSLIAFKLIVLMVMYGMLLMMPLKIKIITVNIICGMFVFIIINNTYQIVCVL